MAMEVANSLERVNMFAKLSKPIVNRIDIQLKKLTDFITNALSNINWHKKRLFCRTLIQHQMVFGLYLQLLIETSNFLLYHEDYHENTCFNPVIFIISL